MIMSYQNDDWLVTLITIIRYNSVKYIDFLDESYHIETICTSFNKKDKQAECANQQVQVYPRCGHMSVNNNNKQAYTYRPNSSYFFLNQARRPAPKIQDNMARITVQYSTVYISLPYRGTYIPVVRELLC